MPTSGLTSTAPELGAFLSSFEQSRRRLREMEAEAAAAASSSPGGGGGRDRYAESERTKHLQQLRDSVSSCRMQLAELEKEVSRSDIANGGAGSGSAEDSPLTGLPRERSARSMFDGNGSGAGDAPPLPPPQQPSPEEKAYVRRVLDVDNKAFNVDGEDADFVDPEDYDPAAADMLRSARRSRTAWADAHLNGVTVGQGRTFDVDGGPISDDMVRAARRTKTAWGQADLRDLTARSAAIDHYSAERSNGIGSANGARSHSGRSLRSDNSIEIVEEGDVVKNFDDSDEHLDQAMSDFMDRAYGYTRTRRAKRIAKVCLMFIVAGAMVVALVTAVAFMGDMARWATGGHGWGGGGGGGGDSDSDSDSAQGAGVSPGKRYDDIRARILESGVTDEGDLTRYSGEEPASPQYMALHWIVEHDTMGLEVDDPFLPQRYALAVFYYSSLDANRAAGNDDTDSRGFVGGGGRDKTNWLTVRGICAWRGIQCHHRPGTAEDETTYDDNGGVTHLEVPRHRIGGTLPREVFRALADLRVVDLSDNDIVGAIPTEIGRLTQLENLKLGRNRIEGTIPTQMGVLTELRDLDLSENLIGGEIPVEVGDMTKLIGLGLFDNVLSGSIPHTLGRLEFLEVLYIDSNELTGIIPAELYSLAKLYDIRLRDNHLTGTISPSLSDLGLLKLLYLDTNDLSGSIPSDIGTLKHLTQLHLFKNSLEGTLPHEVGGLIELEHFSANDNALTGAIPEHFSAMVKVRDLYLYGNKLTGTIPPELGGDKQGSVDDYGMSSLADLRLFDNELTGKIPPRLGNLVHLEHLSLENNHLTGEVPTELGNLSNLAKLRLDGNGFGGSVPPEVCHLRKGEMEGEGDTKGGGEGEEGGERGVGVLVEFLTDCGGDDPKIECDCCTQCVEPGVG